MNHKFFSWKQGGAVLFALIFFAVHPGPVRAATDAANFNAGTGMLSVTGSCSGRYVLVVIKNSANGSIWGSSNPLCVNGSYAYSIAVPDSVRTGGLFSVSATDNGVAATGTVASQPLVFAEDPNLDQTATSSSSDSLSITLDTSSLGIASDDGSWLGNAIQNLFGIATSAMGSAESSIVAVVRLFAKMFTILPGGSITVPSGQNQISGQGTIEAGETDVFITDTAIASSSEVIVTPTSPTANPLSVIDIKDHSGFDVSIVNPSANPISFTWFVVGTYAVGSSSPERAQGNFAEQLIVIPPPVDSTSVDADATSTVATSSVEDGSSPDSSSTDATTTAGSDATDTLAATSSTDTAITPSTTTSVTDPTVATDTDTDIDAGAPTGTITSASDDAASGTPDIAAPDATDTEN